MEQRVRDLLKAHTEQVSAEIRIAIATQGQKILKVVEQQINAIRKDTAMQMKQTKDFAEK
ncbi:hypothetical protein PI124_g14650 [Phytophthora idaei]|nr:hypothetical protein PI125_g14338 [Phytophthora idaei]KAG3145987.1 hypothetical protein PI126_g13514 [Phytophthora idaei]KAG3240454.1 hypothetical protein PI124_g14650 [Phytophthora idaei]